MSSVRRTLQGLDTSRSAEDDIALDAQLATLRARLRAVRRALVQWTYGSPRLTPMLFVSQNAPLRAQAQVVGSALEQERAWLRSRLELLTRAEQQLEFVQRLLREHGRTWRDARHLVCWLLFH